MSNQALIEWRSEHTVRRAELRMAVGVSELIVIQQKNNISFKIKESKLLEGITTCW